MSPTSPTPILQQYIDSTMLVCFRSCHQKFHNEFILGLRPTEHSVDLHAGACFSAALETFYKGVWRDELENNNALARAYGRFVDEWGNFEPAKPTAKTKEKMWAAVEEYLGKYPPKTDPVQPYFLDGSPSVEFSFAIPLDDPGFPVHPVSGEPFIWTGRFDLLGQLTTQNNKIAIRDEKTAGRLESNWAEKWDLRSQFLGYCWSLQRLGIDCSTVVVRGIIITTKEIRLVEATKLYPQHLIDLWYKQLQLDLTRLVKCWENNWWDYNLGDTCTNYGSCAFMPLCSSAEPSRWHSNYRIKRWNPLERNPVAESQTGPAASPASTGTLTSSINMSDLATNLGLSKL